MYSTALDGDSWDLWETSIAPGTWTLFKPTRLTTGANLQFVDHYHEERPHQGLSNTLIAPKITLIGRGSVRCRERLGGVLKFYYREAA